MMSGILELGLEESCDSGGACSLKLNQTDSACVPPQERGFRIQNPTLN